MELEQLRIFTALAAEGSFSVAGQRLYISHSTVSRAVSALEEELGVRLVERDNRFIGLTAAGRALLDEAGRLLNMAEEAAAKVRAAAEKEADKNEIF